MKILATGATGLIGRRLLERLGAEGHSFVVLTRSPQNAQHGLAVPVEVFPWDPLREPAPAEAFAGVDAVVSLAGEPVAARRWSQEQKQRIHDSRVVGTRNLVTTLNRLGASAPCKLVSASAIGFYGDRG